MCVCVCVYIYIYTYIESRWGRDFPPVQTDPGAHAASCKMGTGSFPGVKCGRGVLLTTHPLLVPRSWKSRAIPLPHPLGHTGPVMGYCVCVYIYIYIYTLILKKSEVFTAVKIYHTIGSHKVETTIGVMAFVKTFKLH